MKPEEKLSPAHIGIGDMEKHAVIDGRLLRAEKLEADFIKESRPRTGLIQSLLGAAQMLETVSTMQLSESIFHRTYRKTPLTSKQNKARKRNKISNQARRKNR